MTSLRSRRRAGARGFTLIELLLAISIMMIAFVAIGGTLRGADRAREALDERAERRALARSVLRRIEADLRAIVPPDGVYASGITTTEDVTGDGDTVVTFAIMPGALRFGDERAFAHGALPLVTWSVDVDDETEEAGLVRKVAFVRDSISFEFEDEPDEALATVEVISPEVASITFQFYDGAEWQEVWDSASQDGLPQAIRVVLAMEVDPDGASKLGLAADETLYTDVSLIVALPAGRPAEPLFETEGGGGEGGAAGAEGGGQAGGQGGGQQGGGQQSGGQQGGGGR